MHKINRGRRCFWKTLIEHFWIFEKCGPTPSYVLFMTTPIEGHSPTQIQMLILKTKLHWKCIALPLQKYSINSEVENKSSISAIIVFLDVVVDPQCFYVCGLYSTFEEQDNRGCARSLDESTWQKIKSKVGKVDVSVAWVPFHPPCEFSILTRLFTLTWRPLLIMA